MRWEELTSNQFAEAVAECEGVCLVPLSVIERHGHHLPLGTDMYEGRAMISKAAELEPVMEFPDSIFNQIPEARHLAGTISIDGDLMVKLLDNVCREIARNGFKKIVLVNSHGGNHGLLSLFNMLQLSAPRDYVVYIVDPVSFSLQSVKDAQWGAAAEGGHAGPSETSMMLALRPDLVHMEWVPTDGDGDARNRLQSLKEASVRTGIWWYADYPTHYAGDASVASAEVGERILDEIAETVARAVRAIKADTESKRLQDEFFTLSIAPGA